MNTLDSNTFRVYVCERASVCICVLTLDNKPTVETALSE